MSARVTFDSTGDGIIGFLRATRALTRDAVPVTRSLSQKYPSASLSIARMLTDYYENRPRDDFARGRLLECRRDILAVGINSVHW